MREIRTYGSVGALGGWPPRATRSLLHSTHLPTGLKNRRVFGEGFDRYRPGERTPKLELRTFGGPFDSRIVGRVRLAALLRVRVRFEPRRTDPSRGGRATRACV